MPSSLAFENRSLRLAIYCAHLPIVVIVVSHTVQSAHAAGSCACVWYLSAECVPMHLWRVANFLATLDLVLERCTFPIFSAKLG